MGDDQRRAGDEGFDGGRVNRLARHLFVRNAGDGGNVRRDGLAGLLELIEGIEHAVYFAAAAIFKLDHAEFDDFIDSRRHACGFGVENDPDKRICGRFLAELLLRRKPAQHAVVACPFKEGGETIQDGIYKALHSVSVISHHAVEGECLAEPKRWPD